MLPHVHVQLVLPGENLYSSDELNDAGLYFKLEPGWHVYWKNPGDAGEAPQIKWSCRKVSLRDQCSFRRRSDFLLVR